MDAQWKVADRKLLANVKLGLSLHRDGTEAPNLISVILQNYQTKEVLYGASMTRQVLEETIEKGLVGLSRKRRVWQNKTDLL